MRLRHRVHPRTYKHIHPHPHPHTYTHTYKHSHPHSHPPTLPPTHTLEDRPCTVTTLPTGKRRDSGRLQVKTHDSGVEPSRSFPLESQLPAQFFIHSADAAGPWRCAHLEAMKCSRSREKRMHSSWRMDSTTPVLVCVMPIIGLQCVAGCVAVCCIVYAVCSRETHIHSSWCIDSATPARA